MLSSQLAGPRLKTFFGIAASAILFCGIADSANAGTTTLCPNQATVGGFGYTTGNVVGPLDGTCGTDSAVQIQIPASNDYGKLQFNSGMTGYPSGLTLGGVQGLSANVDFSTTGAEQPYFLLAFQDGSNSLGQTASSDQILFIEFPNSSLSGNVLSLDPSSTLFNLYDNTTGAYLQGGQADTKSIDAWLAEFSSLDSEALQGIWVAEGLAAGDDGSESLTVNSLTVDAAVPEPSSFGLFATALLMLGFAGFSATRRARRLQNQ